MSEKAPDAVPDATPDPIDPVPRIALRPAQAAKAMGVSKRLLGTLERAGKVPSVRFGRAVVFPVAALRRFLDEQAQQKGPSR